MMPPDVQQYFLARRWLRKDAMELHRLIDGRWSPLGWLFLRDRKNPIVAPEEPEWMQKKEKPRQSEQFTRCLKVLYGGTRFRPKWELQRILWGGQPCRDLEQKIWWK